MRGIIAHVWLHFITALVSGALTVLIWRRRRVASGTSVALLMLAATTWAFAYGFELASTDLAAMRWWIRVEYLGIATAPAFWLLFALEYTGHGDWLTLWRRALLFVVPSLTILLNQTNELHSLYYQALAVDRSGPFPLLAITPGPWYWVHITYALLAVLVGTLLFLRMWLRAAPLYRSQLTVIVVGVSVPLAVNLTYLLGLRPFGHIDLTPLAMTITGLIVYWGLVRYQLFDLAPIARNVLFEQLHDAVLVLDVRGRIVDLNHAAQRQLGLSLTAALGQRLTAALSNWPDLATLEDAGDAPVELMVEHLAAQVFAVRRSPLRDTRGQTLGAILVFYDVSEQRVLERERDALVEQLRALASTDGLTGIANRRTFLAAAEQAWQRAARQESPLTVLMLDIDHFKQINDTHGHQVGDRALQAVAQCCRNTVRAIDEVGRYGGEEFAIVLADATLDAAVATAERLRAAVAALEISAHGTVIPVTVSIGVATVYPPVTSLITAFHQADTALYAAKRAGRNRVETGAAERDELDG